MTREEIVEAAVALVERSTREQGLPLHLSDGVDLDQLAAQVANAAAGMVVSSDA